MVESPEAQEILNGMVGAAGHPRLAFPQWPGDGTGLEGELSQRGQGGEIHPEAVPRPSKVLGPVHAEAEDETCPADSVPGPGLRPALFEVDRAADTELRFLCQDFLSVHQPSSSSLKMALQ